MTANDQQTQVDARSTAECREDVDAATHAPGGLHGRATPGTNGSPAVSLREEVLSLLTPARRAILAEHANRVPDDDIVWGIALVLQDMQDGEQGIARRLGDEMTALAQVLEQSRLHIENELHAATTDWRETMDEVLREHRRRDRTAMERAVADVQDESMRAIVDTHLSDILRVLSGRVLTILFVTALGGSVLGAASFALAAHAISTAL